MACSSHLTKSLIASNPLTSIDYIRFLGRGFVWLVVVGPVVRDVVYAAGSGSLGSCHFLQ